MLVRLIVALFLGAILGVERELVGKEAAGIRTEMVVAAGAAIFAMIGVSLPYIIAQSSGIAADSASVVGGLGVIAGVVTGVGFLGAGLIIKINDHPRGITTAALVWTTAAIGVLVGVGLTTFATFAATLIALILYVLRKLDISEKLERREKAG